MPRVITSPQNIPDQQAVDSYNKQLFGTPKERLDFYRKEIQFETGILSDRTNAYLGAQSFLVIAYASAMANRSPEWGHLFTLVVPAALALLGILSSLNAWPGIRAAYLIIQHWHFKQAQLLNSDPFTGSSYDNVPLFSDKESDPSHFRKSLMFNVRSPILFAAFWTVLGVFSIWLQLSHSV